MRRLIVLVTVSTMSLLGLVTLGGAAANATTPGKNGLIVFSADTGAGFQLYTIKPNGSSLRQLTDSDITITEVVWSPDGTRMAFRTPARAPGGRSGRARS